MRVYKTNIRLNDPIYLSRQIKELLKIAKSENNPSALIYSCLECRISLELLDLYLILHSVEHKEREEIIETSKPKNGIDKTNRKKSVLKHKYQLFFQAIYEIFDFDQKYYDFKKSKDLQYQLSKYIHSYHMSNEDLKYNSDIMKKSLVLINETLSFIEKSLPNDVIMGVELKSMPKEDIEVLNEWKNSTKMEYEHLKEKLEVNLMNRRKLTGK